MRAFAELFEELDTTTSTNLKLAAMVRYLSSAAPADAAWATYVLSGRRLMRLIGPAQLRRWLIESACLPEWLVEETLAAVGDLAETIALLMEEPGRPPALDDAGLGEWIEARLLPLREEAEAEKRARVVGWWRSLPYRECLLLNKLLTGALRVGVSETLVLRALAEVSALPRAEVAHRLMGNWCPSAAFWETLRRGPAPAACDPGRPYPFHLASPLDADPSQLGPPADWQAEWKWDGIRAQLVRRAGQSFLWSRGEELVTERFPEVARSALALPDGSVLDGELVAWRDGVRPFGDLQQRIGRRKLTAAILEEVPVRFLAYDLLELDSRDVRSLPLRERREQLERLLGGDRGAIGLSPVETADSWEALTERRRQSRVRRVEGLMLKALDAPYGTGRQRGAWWKWKIDPWSFDGVMIYAHPGHGRRSNLCTDYTFAVWRGEELVPVAKVYSGLTDAEILALDRWIRTHTRERFGPTRALEPLQVFEIGFEGIAASPRHKSGLALRFPRILRWRRDKPPREASTLDDLQGLLHAQAGRG